MMNLITISLGLLSITVSTLANPADFEDICEYYDSNRDQFDIDFLKASGTWYTMARSENPIEPDGVDCMVEKYIQSDDPSNYTFHYTNRIGDKNTIIDGYLEVDKEDQGIAELYTTLGTSFYFELMAIEYSKWSVLYVCGFLAPDQPVVNLFSIRSRQSKMDPADLEAAKRALDDLGVDPNHLNYYNQDQSHCAN